MYPDSTRRSLAQIRQSAAPPAGAGVLCRTSPGPRQLARTRRCAFQLPSKCGPAPRPQPEGRVAWLPESVRATAPAIRRKPPDGPEHPSLWLFFSSQAPHVIETVPLENRRQLGTVDS
jgi:hypothetical protein